MPKPVAVLCSDVHYSLPNLKLADAAMRQAIAKANELRVPLIVAGDLHDTKANLRGECVKVMLETFSLCKLEPIVIRGNHDAIHEKSKEHSLEFLSHLVKLIVRPVKYSPKPRGLEDYVVNTGAYFIPYEHDSNELKTYLKTIPKGSTLIMHQGITGSNSGEYIQDKSAITKDDVAGMRVISGHYHARQTIKLPDDGVWDYIGSPFTMNFGEANDPPKGFQILMDDGSLEFVPTNLRKHIVINADLNSGKAMYIEGNSALDLIWLKVTGTKEQLASYKKPFECRMDLIPLDSNTNVLKNNTLSQSELLDSLIDSLTNTTDEAKIRLKQTWKDLV